MSNPFDQFSSELNSALPSSAAPAQAGDNPFSFAPPTPAPAPSNQPAMNPPPTQTNAYGGGAGGGGGYGQPPAMGGQPPMYGGMGGTMGSQPPMGGMMGGGSAPLMNGMMGGPPPAAPPAMGADPFSGYGAPPQPPAPGPMEQPQTSYGAPPSADPFSSFGGPPPAAPPAGNPYGGPPGPPPQQAPPSAPPTPNPYGASTVATSANTAPNDPFGGYGMAPAPPQQAPPTPQSVQPIAYGQQPPPPQQEQQLQQQQSQPQYGAPPPAGNDPFGGYGAPPAPSAGPPANDPFGGYGAPPPTQQQQPPSQNPYGVPTNQPGFGDQGALVVSQQQSNPYAMPPQQQQQHQQAPPPVAVDPFSVFNSAPAPSPAAPPPPDQQALVPAQPPQQQYMQMQPAAPAPAPANDGDLWGDLGFDAPPQQQQASGGSPEEEKKDSGDLPSGGEYYDARIFTPTLGVMFFKPQELTDSLFLNTERELVDGLGERPVVAFIVEGSSARSAGVELGHVLLKVNGVDVKSPKEASRLIKEGPRPLPLLFYVPNTEVVVAEGEHMVKYDTRETTAPNSAKDWKPKYVVIGGIIAQPWMINMYRSKSEYDIAVIETQARRPVSVKVKQFSLQGARIQNDWQGPQMVKYKNKLHPWKYIVILPVARNPIKISSPNLASLKPVHEGIRRVLLAQQRGRGGNQHTAEPVRQADPYSGNGGGGGGGPPPQQYQQQQQQYHHQQPQYAQQQQYSGY